MGIFTFMLDIAWPCRRMQNVKKALNVLSATTILRSTRIYELKSFRSPLKPGFISTPVSTPDSEKAKLKRIFRWRAGSKWVNCGVKYSKDLQVR